MPYEASTFSKNLILRFSNVNIISNIPYVWIIKTKKAFKTNRMSINEGI